MSKAYVVCQRDYSDCDVIAVYSSQEKAEEAVRLGLGNSIDDVLLDAEVPVLPNEEHLFRVWLYDKENKGGSLSVLLGDFDVRDDRFVLKQVRNPQLWREERAPQLEYWIVEVWAVKGHEIAKAKELLEQHLAKEKK